MSDPTTSAMTGRRASLTALAGVLGAVGLMLLLVTWAASIGPQEVVRGEGNPPHNMSAPTSTATSTGASSGSSRPAGGGDQDILFTIVTIVATLLAAVVMLAVILSMLRWLLTRRWGRTPRDPEPAEVEFDPLEVPALLGESMAQGAAGQRALLVGGSPRNAIVACWQRFEEQAESAGVRRRPWETSSEFTLRILDAVSADGPAVLRLAELYRAARHSDHEITEADRAEALEALDVVHRSLGDRAGGRR